MAPHNGKFVAYYRVSTDRQGMSGLGIEAQREAVERFLNGGKWSVIGEFTEIESGTRRRLRNRPMLDAAMRLAKKEKATLVVAKLDRLARDVQFISTLLNNQVKFICADMPEADKTFLQMMSVFAEYEAKRISERTKDALSVISAQLRKKGVYKTKARPELGIMGREINRLGSPAPKIGSAVATELRVAEADAYADRVGPIVRDIIKKTGASTLREIAQALTARGVKTPRGNDEWHASQVANLLKRVN
jgi:DNA invertase Pin-like site-specific DNA recombinase